MHAVRSGNAVGHLDGLASARNVVDGWRQSLLRLAELGLLRRSQPRVAQIHAAFSIRDDAIRTAERKPLKTFGEDGFFAGRPHDSNSREPRLGLKRDEASFTIDRHPQWRSQAADE